MFRIGEGRYGISKKERERNSPCLGVERLSEVRHIHNTAPPVFRSLNELLVRVGGLWE